MKIGIVSFIIFALHYYVYIVLTVEFIIDHMAFHNQKCNGFVK
jgi:hypothetical protein